MCASCRTVSGLSNSCVPLQGKRLAMDLLQCNHTASGAAE